MKSGMVAGMFLVRSPVMMLLISPSDRDNAMHDRPSRDKKSTSSNRQQSFPAVPAAPDLSMNGLPAGTVDMLHLQRTIGNRQVQRLLESGTIAVNQRAASGSIQRKLATGLAKNNRSSDFVASAHAYINDPANKDTSLGYLGVALTFLMSAELESIGVPAVKAVID